MEKITNFEDLEVWKKSMRLSVSIYELMRNCKDFGFKDQIQRASVSIPSKGGLTGNAPGANNNLS